MDFLQPFMFWGALAVAIPVLIHFWHQRKGKQLDWAAMQWLAGSSHQQSRGFRLDDLPLLLVRCMLLIFLVFLLSQPVWKGLNKSKRPERIHLVETSAYLINSYRFELETALKNGDKIFWIDPSGEEAKDLRSLPKEGQGIYYMQDMINKVSKADVQLDLYLLNTQRLMDLPRIYIPCSYTIHTAMDSSKNGIHPHLDLGEGKKLFIAKGNLTVSKSEEPLPRLAPKPRRSGPLKVLVEYADQAEQQTVEAALAALASVYSLPLKIDLKNNLGTDYDLVLTDRSIKHPAPETLYVLSGLSGQNIQSTAANVIQLQDSLRIHTSDMVRTGQLPEWLGNLLVSHFKLEEKNGVLSRKQLNALFVRGKPLEAKTGGDIRSWLLLVFIALIMLERWMALRKTIQKSDA